MGALDRRCFVLASIVAPYATILAVKPARASGYQAKNTVAYREVPNGKFACENCKLFEPNPANASASACTVVAGPILPQAWCVIYEAKPAR